MDGEQRLVLGSSMEWHGLACHLRERRERERRGRREINRLHDRVKVEGLEMFLFFHCDIAVDYCIMLVSC